jgi:hypothetical protein
MPSTSRESLIPHDSAVSVSLCENQVFSSTGPGLGTAGAKGPVGQRLPLDDQEDGEHGAAGASLVLGAALLPSGRNDAAPSFDAGRSGRGQGRGYRDAHRPLLAGVP